MIPKRGVRTDKDKKGIMLIAAVGIVLLGIFAVKACIERDPTRDAASCVGTPDLNTVVLLDLSEQISTQTLNEIRARALAFIRDSTAQNELVSVFTVSDLSRDSLAPTIALCRPPESGNRIVQNVQVIERGFRERFTLPIEQALQFEPGNGAESPIAQSLIDISRTRYLRGRRNTLLIFSDMLENTHEYSLYGCRDPSTVVSRFRASRRGAVERPSFNNTRVVLNLIPRVGQSAASLICRDKLWVWFFGDNPGSDAGVEVDYLPGGVPAGRATARDSA